MSDASQGHPQSAGGYACVGGHDHSAHAHGHDRRYTFCSIQLYVLDSESVQEALGLAAQNVQPPHRVDELRHSRARTAHESRGARRDHLRVWRGEPT